MAKGKKTGGGSRKGVPNKATAEIKTMIEGALSDVGGRKYLVKQAKDNPTAFLTLIGKVVPRVTEGPGPNGEHSLRFVMEWGDRG